MNQTEQDERQLTCGRYVIAVLAAVLQKKDVPPLPAGLSWGEVYEMARQHAVEAMVFSAVSPAVKTAEPELYARWKRGCDQDMAQTLTQMGEEPRLLAAFSGAGLRAMPVKGSALRGLYPSPDYRQMSDIDLIIQPEESTRAVELMGTLGYRPPKGDITREHEASFNLPPFLSVELHDSPVKPDDSLAAYYRDIWEKAEPDPALPGIFHLKTEDEYLYLLAHFIQHYEDAGIGIRQVMDVFIFRQAHGGQMDNGYLDEETRKMNIAPMRQNIEALADFCFAGESEEPSEDVREMEEFCILSGIYGTHRSRSICIMRKAQRAEEKSRGWKLRYLWRRAFPPKEEMFRRYPQAREKQWLLPYFWLCRLLDGNYWKNHFHSELSALNHTEAKK